LRFFLLAGILDVDAVEEDSTYNYREGLVLVQRGNDQKSKVDVGPHIRGSRLRSSSACFEEVDLLLPGTARSLIDFYLVNSHALPMLIYV
jgi:1-phosphatidylinositol-4-phosphate 5-kinase